MKKVTLLSILGQPSRLHLRPFCPKNSQLITGVVLDASQKIEGYIARITTLRTFSGSPVFPILALAHHSLATLEADLANHEHTYYNNKQLQREQWANEETENARLLTFFGDLAKESADGLMSSLQLQASATQSLVDSIRRLFPDELSPTLEQNLGMIRSVNIGLNHANNRLHHRADFVHARYVERSQDDVARKTQKVLTLMRDLAEQRNTSLTESHDVNSHMRAIAERQAQSSQLVTAITILTPPFLVTQTFSVCCLTRLTHEFCGLIYGQGIFQMYESQNSKVFWPLVASFTTLIWLGLLVFFVRRNFSQWRTLWKRFAQSDPHKDQNLEDAALIMRPTARGDTGVPKIAEM